MRAAHALLAALAVSLLAGCTDQAPAGTAPSLPAALGEGDATAPPTPQEGEGVPAPQWRPGDWWTWDVTLRDAPSFQATTAVARADGSHYTVGWSEVETGLRSQFLHFIPHGEVAVDDLAWVAHGEPVDWLEFPLFDGAAWTGGTWLEPMAFEARAAADGFAIHGAGEEGIVVDMDWSTELGTFTHLDFYLFSEEPWLTLDLADSGSGRSGAVEVLHLEEMIIAGWGLPWLMGPLPPRVSPAVVDVPVEDGLTHFSFGCYAGGAPGRYHGWLMDPDGTRTGCETNNVGTNDEPLVLEWGPLVPGTWRLNLAAAGEGYTFVELFLLRAESVVPQA